jgi:hypothetical protein
VNLSQRAFKLALIDAIETTLQANNQRWAEWLASSEARENSPGGPLCAVAQKLDLPEIFTEHDLNSAVENTVIWRDGVWRQWRKRHGKNAVKRSAGPPFELPEWTHA